MTKWRANDTVPMNSIISIVVGIVVDVDVPPVGKRLGGPSSGSTATAANNYYTAVADTIRSTIQHIVAIFLRSDNDSGQRNSIRPMSTTMATAR